MAHAEPSPRAGNETQRSLLQAFGSPAAILATPAATLKQFVRPAVANAIVKDPNDDALAQVSSWLEDPLNHIVTLADADYPQTLLNIPDPPLLCT